MTVTPPIVPIADAIHKAKPPAHDPPFAILAPERPSRRGRMTAWMAGARPAMTAY
jgi:hypothetical protein